MKVVIYKLAMMDEATKKEAMKRVTDVSGVLGISVDVKERLMMVTGHIDPVAIALKLRKICHTELVSLAETKEEGRNKKKKSKKNEGENEANNSSNNNNNNMNYYYLEDQPSSCPSSASYTAYEQENSSGCRIC